MGAPIILTREDILRAMRVTKSNNQAARYLGVHIGTYSKYARLYIDEKSGKSLYELHLSGGKGIPKLRKNKNKDIPINRLINGINEYPNYPLSRLKDRLINEHILAEECCSCGFKDRRIIDYKVPIMLSFKDGNKFNWGRDNLQFLCYNCYFIQIGDILPHKLSKFKNDDFKEEKNMESKVWEIDENMKEHFKELGLITEEDDKDEFDFTDYTK